MKGRKFCNAVLAGVTITLFSAASAAADPSGLWRGSDGGMTRVAPCDGPAYCGFLASVVPPNDPDTGRPWTDKYNPDPALRNRPLVGVQVLTAMQPNGAGKWSGQLYHYGNGKTYSGNLIERDANTIRVEGCWLGICGGYDLTRVPDVPARSPPPGPADKRGGGRGNPRP
jgi:uncharacterized protein (DUF2147 family)